MKEELIAQAAGLIQKIQMSPAFDEAEQEFLKMLLLEATRGAIELAESGASA
jgi:hypothetical protein